MHYGERIKSRSQVIYYDAGALGQPLQPPNRKRLPNIEDTKEYKAREKSFPSQRDSDERNQLSRDLINDDELGILQAGRVSDQRRGGDCDQGHSRGGDDGCPGPIRGRDP